MAACNDSDSTAVCPRCQKMLEEQPLLGGLLPAGSHISQSFTGRFGKCPLLRLLWMPLRGPSFRDFVCDAVIYGWLAFVKTFLDLSFFIGKIIIIKLYLCSLLGIVREINDVCVSE